MSISVSASDTESGSGIDADQMKREPVLHEPLPFFQSAFRFRAALSLAIFASVLRPLFSITESPGIFASRVHIRPAHGSLRFSGSHLAHCNALHPLPLYPFPASLAVSLAVSLAFLLRSLHSHPTASGSPTSGRIRQKSGLQDYSIARRFASAWVKVSSSTYSSSSPNPIPRAIEVTFTSGNSRSRFIR